MIAVKKGQGLKPGSFEDMLSTHASKMESVFGDETYILGFSCAFDINPKKEWGFVYFTNSEYGDDFGLIGAPRYLCNYSLTVKEEKKRAFASLKSDVPSLSVLSVKVSTYTMPSFHSTCWVNSKPISPIFPEYLNM